jgi:hypothetical protein
MMFMAAKTLSRKAKTKALGGTQMDVERTSAKRNGGHHQRLDGRIHFHYLHDKVHSILSVE